VTHPSCAFDFPLPAVLGFEFAGVVDIVGAGVTDVKPGDRVAGWPDGPVGAYAENTVSSNSTTIPDEVTFEQAAATVVGADNTSRGLAQLNIQPGESLLVHAASGALGSTATQLPVLAGVRVSAPRASPTWTS
jgi:NADPH:quinone reductase-like Zn-dependent oxidoreductase